MNNSEQRKKLKETGLTPSYIEWVIWQTTNAVPEGVVQYQGKTNEKD
jgi:hypothetical protein